MDDETERSLVPIPEAHDIYEAVMRQTGCTREEAKKRLFRILYEKPSRLEYVYVHRRVRYGDGGERYYDLVGVYHNLFDAQEALFNDETSRWQCVSRELQPDTSVEGHDAFELCDAPGSNIVRLPMNRPLESLEG